MTSPVIVFEAAITSYTNVNDKIGVEELQKMRENMGNAGGEWISQPVNEKNVCRKSDGVICTDPLLRG